MIRVVLIDDQPLIRSGIRALLGGESDIEVCGEASDGATGVDVIREARPDVALVDVQMPIVDGIELTRHIAAEPELRGVHLVMLTNYGLDEYVFEALRAGAAGFLVKDIEPEDLIHAVHLAARGESLLAPSITRALIDRYVAAPPVRDDSRLGSLTNREREAVRLAAHGLDNQEIARAMVISPLTAKTHISRAMSKLSARDRAQLVVIAYQCGLVVVGTD